MAIVATIASVWGALRLLESKDDPPVHFRETISDNDSGQSDFNFLPSCILYSVAFFPKSIETVVLLLVPFLILVAAIIYRLFDRFYYGKRVYRAQLQQPLLTSPNPTSSKSRPTKAFRK